MGDGTLVVMLDGIEDPFNHGQAVRALYAAGVDALVVRRDWESAVAVVTRASAGATELMPTAMAPTAHDAADVLRQAGMRIVVADSADDAVPVDEANLRPRPLAIPEFMGEDPRLGADIANVVAADLESSGLFQPLDRAAFIEQVRDLATAPRFADWRSVGAEALVVGRVGQSPDGVGYGPTP